MFLKTLVIDRFCKGRFIGYFQHRIQVFYQHELRSLAELFGFADGSSRPGILLSYESQNLTNVLSLETLDLPPPERGHFFQSKKSFRLALSLALPAFAFIILNSGSAYALPTGMQSVSGNIQFNQTGSTLNVTTQATRSIANYQSFNINQGETVNFNLPSSQSAILNRVVGGNPSQILGAMHSNGQVFLSNSSGIIFGQSAQVNVGSLFATTLGISNSDFLNGKMTFSKDPNVAPASIINEGTIQAQSGGFIAFSGSAISNSGTITAPLGQINLTVGDQVTMTEDNNLQISVTIDQALQNKVAAVNDAISNSGTLNAQGGTIHAEAELANALYDHAVNNTGEIAAQGFQSHNGVIELTSITGSIANTGTIDASGTQASPNGGLVHLEGDTVVNTGNLLATGDTSGKGGTIEVLGNTVSLLDQAQVDVSGDQGGGVALIGGDTHGGNNVRTATMTTIDSGVSLKADAGTYGDGGKVVVWADNTTDFGGTISAKGGLNGGNGGFVETSGKQTLNVTGMVDASATKGTAGTWLMDPYNITIGTTDDGNGSITGSNPTGDANISHTTIETALNAGTNVDITTGGNGSPGSSNGDITVSSAITLNTASNNNATLTLSAYRNINVNAAITGPTTGSGKLSIILDADNSANGSGVINIAAAITSNGGNMTFSGDEFALPNTGSINAGAGTVTITPTTAKAISVAGATDQNDNAGSGGTMDVSSAELGRVKATSLTIGSAGIAGGLTVSGNINVTGTAGITAGA